jgi:hypothetical protein
MTDRVGQAAEEFFGLAFATIILYFMDPVIAQTFNSALSTSPAFASSPAGGLWKLLTVIFSLHIDIVLMWLAFLLALFGSE